MEPEPGRNGHPVAPCALCERFEPGLDIQPSPRFTVSRPAAFRESAAWIEATVNVREKQMSGNLIA